ncbi:MAG: helix-turn-helix domain-containing protein [Nocardioides sp.]
MTAEELRQARGWLGVTAEWLAEWLDVSLRSVRRWEAGTHRIPDGVAEALGRLEQHHDNHVTLVSARWRAQESGDYPPGWWTMVEARRARQSTTSACI